MEKYRALLTVDAEKFSAHRDADLPHLHMEIRRALAAACTACGLAEAWESARFKESTGDGILVVLPAETIPALVEPFPTRLQEALAEAAPGLRARGLRLRLRAALHVGLVDDEREEAPGISAAAVTVCRLGDSEPLRDALAGSDPDVTFVAFLLSDEVFRHYVAAGRTALHESQFTRVRAVVKQFSESAYLRVPVPSAVAVPLPEADLPVRGGEISISGVTINGRGSRNAFGNTVNGDFRMG
ncbi:hypothetical protein ACFY19_35285 [Streptosporangium saharense]|uniref:Uncharacterized protein n=1 Tax=Streptosporangium saharense TaxID=1706840 RepID=A0A7W7QUJ6_9ACTN|nr:hypothetical protein [Streptosporangium saharense]MBB4920017.1 hypothetical protein [Streptosporangium saharense]